ncbi:MAG: ribokinase [Delftia sp.]|nr:ribokinase [Delftia sp.]
MSIVVFGSINMDLVARAPRLPAPGETLIGHSFQTFPGGKGANQAVACARLGASARMVGRVGGDVFGAALREQLRAEGVDDELVAVDESAASGVALIAVDDQAENNIIVVPGANGQVGPADLARLETALAEARVLLLQLEIPMEMVVAAASLARQRGVTVMLDPAPAQTLPAELYSLVDILTPNTTEAAALVGSPVQDVDDARRAASALRERGARRVIVKMGSLGVVAGGSLHPAIAVTAVDSVAAGDAFNGALAVALSEGLTFEQALRWGLAGGALAVTKHGAQTSMPDRASLLALLAM